jgi:uncharacterized protein YjbI with pentapeptide repeats
MTNDQLEEYFCQDKSDWYIINNGGQKIWDNHKVEEFWDKIRTYKMAIKNYNFDNYVFPKFLRNGYYADSRKSTFKWDFWEANEVMDFNSDVSFISARFLDQAHFTAVKFTNVKFFYTVFEDSANFDHCLFIGQTNFGLTKFNDSGNFSYTQFDSAEFSNLNFERNTTTFFNAEFKNRVRFVNVNFNSRIIFRDIVLNEDSDFLFVCFNGNTDFGYARFKKRVLFDGVMGKVNLDMINCGEHSYKSISIEKKYLSTPPRICFKNSIFNRECYISSVDLKDVTFDLCDVSNLTFIRCVWIISNGRLITNEEGRELIDLEEHYRQLKRNFDDRKDWEKSGLAYVSEMEIRKMRLYKEKKYYQWFIYWFYGFFGGYTQDFKKPVISIAGLISISTLIFYFIDFNIVHSIQRSFKGALPYIEIGIQKPFSNYWLIIKNIETVLGGTFLTFFILAIRKRFKQ